MNGLCDHCTFNHACCLGSPKYEWRVDEEGTLSKIVDHCDAFVESQESLIENP
jgi:hypothetical protein